MSSRQEYPSPQSHLSKIDDTSTALTSDGEQTMEAVTTSIVTAQFDLLVLMSQCALAWALLPVRLAGAHCSQDEQQQVVLGNGAKIFSRVAAISGAAWQAAPIITGIEETLNDQFSEPRPHETQQRDMLTLWERSNEFELTRAPANARASENLSQPA